MAGLHGHDHRPLGLLMWAVLSMAAWPGLHARLPDRPWAAHALSVLGPPAAFLVLAAVVAAGGWVLERWRRP